MSKEHRAVPGIHRLALPTPYAVGPVNCWLVEDDPLTLVDCGPNTGTALAALDAQLASLGYARGDIGLVLLTHHHPDHLGLAPFLRAAGARIACLDAMVPAVQDWDSWFARDDEDAALLMARHGVPAWLVAVLRRHAGPLRAWGAATPVDRALGDGELLHLGRRALQVLHRPGHSPYDTLFVDQDAGVAIGGDHLLAGISSNAVVCRAWDEPDGRERPRSLLIYRRSLRETAQLDVDLVLGGHGDPVAGHRELITRRLEEQDRRAERLLGHLGDRHRTAHELAVDLWGDRALTQTFASLSEVLGHLDLLVVDGRVIELDDGPVTRFARAS